MIYRRRGRALRQVEPILPDWPEPEDFDRRRGSTAKRTRLSVFHAYMAGPLGLPPIRPGPPAEYVLGEPLLIEEELDRL